MYILYVLLLLSLIQVVDWLKLLLYQNISNCYFLKLVIMPYSLRYLITGTCMGGGGGSIVDKMASAYIMYILYVLLLLSLIQVVDWLKLLWYQNISNCYFLKLVIMPYSLRYSFLHIWNYMYIILWNYLYMHLNSNYMYIILWNYLYMHLNSNVLWKYNMSMLFRK